MATSVLHTRPYGLVLAESSIPCLITQWRAFASAAEFITLQQVALRYFEAHSTPAQPWGWVGDVQRLEAIPVQAQDWLLAEFTPRAAAAGLRELSLVQPPTHLGPQEDKQAAGKATQCCRLQESRDHARVVARQACSHVRSTH